MFADHVFTIFGYGITTNDREIWMAGTSVLALVVAWIAPRFNRRRFVVLQRSHTIEQMGVELSRIADALVRIANRPADQVIAAAVPAAEPQSQTCSTRYLIFGR